MDDYQRVRRLREIEGKKIREIKRITGFHRTTIRKMLKEGAPPGYRRSPEPAPRPVLGPFIPVIDWILAADKTEPNVKQRHTATKIWHRLKEEFDYPGGITQVKEYVSQARQLKREAFVPLEFPLATAQVDWGEADVMVEGHRRRVYLFVMTLPYSNVRFVACFPSQEGQYFYEGHRLAFEFLGGVPRIIIYDNLKTAVFKLRKKGRRTLNRTFQSFCDHYLFEARFCNPRSGNEKGHVENGVKWARKNLFVPPPQLVLWEEFNRELAERCRGFFAQRVRGCEETIRERWLQEKHDLLSIPATGPLMFQPVETTVRSLCLVRFDTNDYSVPCRYAHHPVTIRATLDEVRVFHQHQRIAVHRRCFEKEQAIYEPWHYLPLIERKPRALDDGAPMKRLDLDDCFAILRRRLEAVDDEESSKGTRAYIRVLQLLEHHSSSDLTRAVQRALDLGVHDEEAIKNLLLCPPERNPTPLDLTGRYHLVAYRVPLPEIASYGTLLSEFRGGVS